MSQSEKIRNFLKSSPTSTAAEVAKKVGCAPQLVYQVKAAAAKKAKKAVAKTVPTNGDHRDDPVDLVIQAKALADRCGGAKGLSRLVDALFG